MTTDVCGIIYSATDKFLNDQLKTDIFQYALDSRDYHVDWIVLKLDYLKSEYWKSNETKNYERVGQIRRQIAEIMPGFIVMKEFE